MKSAAVETQKAQFAAQMGVRKDELDLSAKRLGVDQARLALAAKEAERRTLTGQIKEFRDLGVAISDEDVKALGGIKDGADPLLKAELEIIAARARNEANLNYDPTVDLAKAFQNSASRAQTKTIVTDLRAAAKDGVVPEALAKLRSVEDMTEERLRQLAKLANVPYVAPPVTGVQRNPAAGVDAIPPPIQRRMGTGGPQGLNVDPRSIQP